MVGWNRLKRELIPLVVIAAVSVGFLWRSTLGGRVLLPADLLLVMEPWRHYRHQFPEFHRVSNPMLDPVQAFYPWRKYAAAVRCPCGIPTNFAAPRLLRTISPQCFTRRHGSML